ncbi:hypothetical protein [Kineococcus aurantiacus]|uniref:Uncharacterized protein n=1 Tax=Kineococcus aurantiacus TaxID=37633 RepID=A0A7Y9J2R0_9ACTN|nr:hypothetical protein [Kineococcus aurantiacus]NYD24532.1 hypothetical protein [Kineococcus aurantiacus]
MSTDQPSPVRALLRRCVLATSVVDDLDLELDDEGVRLPGTADLAWDDLARAAGEAPEETARLRVAALLHAHAELHRDDARVVPLAVPVGADRHPAAGWAHRGLLGGALDLGLGVVVPRGRSERLLPLPEVSARATGRPVLPGEADLARLEGFGALVVERLVRDAGGSGDGVLRPVGGCDVPTLLASRTLREHLVAGPDRSPGNLLRAVAVPDRTRGWFDLTRIDPAYVGAAWVATDPAERGLRRPVLVTREEVALAPTNPRLVEEVLAGRQ